MMPYPTTPIMQYAPAIANTAYGHVPYWGTHYNSAALAPVQPQVPAIVVPEPDKQPPAQRADVIQFQAPEKPGSKEESTGRKLGMTALLGASKLGIGYVGVGLLNKFLFGVSAHYAGGLEALFALIETGITSGIVYNKIPGSNAIVKGVGKLFGHEHTKSLEDMSTKEREACIAPISAILTGISTMAVTALSFMKAKSIHGQIGTGKSWLSAFRNVTPRSLLTLGAGLVGSLAIGYIEGWVSEKVAAVALPKEA